MSRFKRVLLFLVVASFSSLTLAVSPPKPNATIDPNPAPKINAEYWLTRMKQALKNSQFEAGIVRLKGEKTESFQWLHGVITQQTGDVELERISPLIGGGITTIRKNNVVTFIEPNKEPVSVFSDSIRNFIPPIFYKDVKALIDSYQFVLVSKSQIAGRSAQLIRIESIDKTSFNYWIWIDVASALPLRLAYVNERSEVIEQVLMTHLTVHQQPHVAILELADLDVPPPPSSNIAPLQKTASWNISWLPRGFELVKNDRHHVSISREISDYYLYSDGLVELSIYVQRPLDSFNSPLVLNDGATSFVMVRADGYDVTVVGKVPLAVAHKVAVSVKSSQ